MKNKTVRMLSFIALTAIPFLSIKQASAGDNPTIGEISYFAGNFAPRGWAKCDGQLLQINRYTALFSLIGIQYGGDGRTTFALPNMRGRVAVHQGQGPGLSHRVMGQRLGSERVLVLPLHSHTMSVSTDSASTTTATNRSLATAEIYKDASPAVDLHATTLRSEGGSRTISNVQPSISAHCIIALEGTFPSRN